MPDSFWEGSTPVVYCASITALTIVAVLPWARSNDRGVRAHGGILLGPAVAGFLVPLFQIGEDTAPIFVGSRPVPGAGLGDWLEFGLCAGLVPFLCVIVAGGILAGAGGTRYLVEHNWLLDTITVWRVREQDSGAAAGCGILAIPLLITVPYGFIYAIANWAFPAAGSWLPPVVTVFLVWTFTLRNLDRSSSS